MKLNWGFGIAAAYILFAGSMIWFAVKASQQKNDLVTENYYEEAVKYQDKIDAGINASDTASSLLVDYMPDKNAIEITPDQSLKKGTGSIYFYKPDNSSDDFKLNFQIENNEKKILPLKKMQHGYWKLNISWNAENKNFYMEKRVFIK